MKANELLEIRGCCNAAGLELDAPNPTSRVRALTTGSSGGELKLESRIPAPRRGYLSLKVSPGEHPDKLTKRLRAFRKRLEREAAKQAWQAAEMAASEKRARAREADARREWIGEMRRACGGHAAEALPEGKRLKHISNTQLVDCVHWREGIRVALPEDPKRRAEFLVRLDGLLGSNL